MSTAFKILSSPHLLPTALRMDAASCALMGIALLLFAGNLSSLLGLPVDFMRACGLVLFPCAVLMLVAAYYPRPPAILLLLIIGGNIAWVMGSVLIAALWPLTTLGQGFVLTQAFAVAVLAGMEFVGWRRY